MKKIIFLLLLVFITSSICYADIEFCDIDNHWAKTDINTLVINHSIEGFSDGTFRPNDSIKVDEFLKILISECNLKLKRQGSNWSETYAFAAIDHELIKEDAFSDYRRPLLRFEAAKIIANFVDLKDVKSGKNTFKDLSKENKETVLKIVKLGIMSGYSDGTFREQSEVTRAQACKIILNSIKAKQELSKNRKFELNHKNTNIGEAESGDVVQDIRYKINKNRLYIYDSGRYSNSEWTTLNQEYINDEKVIKVIKALVDDSSYTEVIYVPDKYTVDSLNICYGSREGYVNNGSYNFSIRFYENALYNPKKANDIDFFTDKACMLIQIDRLWDTVSEYNKDGINEYRKYRLEEAIGACLDKGVKKEFTNYIVKKLQESRVLENNDFEPKIVETEKIGKYTINTLCIKDSKLYFYIDNF